MEKIKTVEIRAPCGHFYDLKCLTDLFRSTLNDESLFPPRCCKEPFVFHDVRRYFDHELAVAFETKSIEFSVVNRVYCRRPTCSAFLGAATDVAKPLSCAECLWSTCGHCKDAAHGTTPCSANQDETVLALAEQKGWKRCPGCHRIVELVMGCHHMTCICKKQFCYVCTETWKTCCCPQWEENRLYAAAVNRVDRRMHDEPAVRVATVTTADYNRRVAQEAERLRVNHHCDHRNWRLRHGGGTCEWCGHYLPRYLLVSPHDAPRYRTMADTLCRWYVVGLQGLFCYGLRSLYKKSRLNVLRHLDMPLFAFWKHVDPVLSRSSATR